MEVKTGYLYHIKDEFFTKMKDPGLMQNHEIGHTRPTYFTIKDEDILWFIPISSKVEKYEKIVQNKQTKFGYCDSILIRKIADKKQAILIQNAFPTLEKYIDHVHTFHGVPLKVGYGLRNEILNSFKHNLELKKAGLHIFYPDIDKLKAQMYQELIEDRAKQVNISKLELDSKQGEKAAEEDPSSSGKDDYEM